MIGTNDTSSIHLARKGNKNKKNTINRINLQTNISKVNKDECRFNVEYKRKETNAVSLNGHLS